MRKVKVLIRCPVCGRIDDPHTIANHFCKQHPEEYAVVQKYAVRHAYGWICTLCNKDFSFITSVYVHIMKEHLKEEIENNINIILDKQLFKTDEEEVMLEAK